MSVGIWGENKYLRQSLPETNIDIIKIKALNCHWCASYLINCYEQGKRVRKNMRKAYKLIVYAKNNLSPYWALYKLGVYYFHGLVIKKDLTQAFNTWKQCYEKIEKDFYRAGCKINENWVDNDAKQAFAAVCYNLAYCYFNGIVVERNIDTALFYLKESAKIPNREAYYALAKLHSGDYNLPKDNRKAFRYRKSICDYDFATSNDFHNVGVCYQKGIGVRKNLEEAFKYYKKAADMGNPESIMIITNCYIYGMGVEKNDLMGLIYSQKLRKTIKFRANRQRFKSNN